MYNVALWAEPFTATPILKYGSGCGGAEPPPTVIGGGWLARGEGWFCMNMLHPKYWCNMFES